MLSILTWWNLLTTAPAILNGFGVIAGDSRSALMTVYFGFLASLCAQDSEPAPGTNQPTIHLGMKLALAAYLVPLFPSVMNAMYKK
mmetsp:Transcript_21342/g.33184  ORF Transcript_21342/g.33184 Transcript_21342/m.33184 type:complete len:86 (-) Transcript_21342:20-277(-)